MAQFLIGPTSSSALKFCSKIDPTKRIKREIMVEDEIFSNDILRRIVTPDIREHLKLKIRKWRVYLKNEQGWGDNYIKMCSTSYVTREMTGRHYYLHQSERPNKFHNTDNKSWQEHRAEELICKAGGDTTWYRQLWKAVCWFLTKLKHILITQGSDYVMSFTQEELKFYVHTVTWIELYSRFTHDCPNLDQTEVFFISRVDRLW